MVKIIIGTTPTIKYKFSIVDPADFTEAIMTIKDSRKQEKLRKTLDEATVGTDYIEWTLTQEETLSLGTGSALSMMLNWLTTDGDERGICGRSGGGCQQPHPGGDER